MPQSTKTAFPANLLKFNAYIKVTDSLEAAIKVVKDKRLAYGEPCIVTYNAPIVGDDTSTNIDTSKNKGSQPLGVTRRILFAIGSMDPKNPYFFGLEYDKDGNPVDQADFDHEIMKIIDEFKEKGFTITSIKYSKTEEPNINDTEFSYGDIILGEGAVKQVTEEVLENSKDLVTSEGIYEFVMRLIRTLEAKVNEVAEDVSVLKADVSTVKVTIGNVIKSVKSLKNDVSAIYVTIGSTVQDINTVKEDVSANTLIVGKLSKDVSTLRTEVTYLRNDVSNFYVTIGSVISDVSTNKSDITSLKHDTSVVQLDLNLQKVIIGKLIQDVSALTYDASHGINSIVSDSSFITVRTLGRTVGIGFNASTLFSGDIKLNEDDILSLYWNKYEEE